MMKLTDNLRVWRRQFTAANDSESDSLKKKRLSPTQESESRVKLKFVLEPDSDSKSIKRGKKSDS